MRHFTFYYLIICVIYIHYVTANIIVSDNQPCCDNLVYDIVTERYEYACRVNGSTSSFPLRFINTCDSWIKWKLRYEARIEYSGDSEAALVFVLALPSNTPYLHWYDVDIYEPLTDLLDNSVIPQCTMMAASSALNGTQSHVKVCETRDNTLTFYYGDNRTVFIDTTNITITYDVVFYADKPDVLQYYTALVATSIIALLMAIIVVIWRYMYRRGSTCKLIMNGRSLLASRYTRRLVALPVDLGMKPYKFVWKIGVTLWLAFTLSFMVFVYEILAPYGGVVNAFVVMKRVVLSLITFDFDRLYFEDTVPCVLLIAALALLFLIIFVDYFAFSCYNEDYIAFLNVGIVLEYDKAPMLYSDGMVCSIAYALLVLMAYIIVHSDDGTSALDMVIETYPLVISSLFFLKFTHEIISPSDPKTLDDLRECVYHIRCQVRCFLSDKMSTLRVRIISVQTELKLAHDDGAAIDEKIKNILDPLDAAIATTTGPVRFGSVLENVLEQVIELSTIVTNNIAKTGLNDVIITIKELISSAIPRMYEDGESGILQIQVVPHRMLKKYCNTVYRDSMTARKDGTWHDDALSRARATHMFSGNARLWSSCIHCTTPRYDVYSTDDFIAWYNQSMIINELNDVDDIGGSDDYLYRNQLYDGCVDMLCCCCCMSQFSPWILSWQRDLIKRESPKSMAFITMSNTGGSSPSPMSAVGSAGSTLPVTSGGGGGLGWIV